MDLVIYGAQGYALSTYEALKTLYPKRAVCCFLVTQMGMNAPMLDGIPVKELAVFSEGMSDEEKRNIEILIATPDHVQPEIEETLENYGFQYHSRLNFARRTELMKLFHVRLGKFLPLSALPVGYHMPFVRIYMAKSQNDHPLKNVMHLPEYIFPVQAGADCCEVKISDLADNTGEHISDRNGNYCELTVLYWMWKNKLNADGLIENDVNQYYGLAQYRRMFTLDRDDLLRLVDNEVDVVLPYPMLYQPDIQAHHERYLKDEDWNILLDVLKEEQSEYMDVFSKILGQRYLYNYNVILARKNVLREYCEWLFPILEKVEEYSVPKGTDRRDRYLGYMGETLETLYFMANAGRFTVVHTGCEILI